MKDYYYILGLPVAASKDEIKEAYRKLSKKFHPDVNLGDKYFEDRFKEIQEAYETLIDDIRRNNYDFKRQESNPVSEDSETKYNPKHPYSNVTSQRQEVKTPKGTTIGIILLICLILIIIFIFLNNNGRERTSLSELSIPKEICDCNLKITDENIDIKKYSFEPEASVYINNQFDSLYGNIDSIIEKEFEKKRKFDEDVEDFVRTTTYHYIHNKLVKPQNTFKEKCYSEVNNRLIKKTLIDGNSDSTTLKYEYNNCNNEKLSSIKVYNKNGEKIALCNISYDNTQGIISIITCVRDWKSYSLDDLSKVISNYEIKIDKDCKVQSVKYIWTDGISQRREEETYNDKGLIVESKSYTIDKTERLLSSNIYEYQYDKMMNWIVKITNQNRITRRTIFYRNPNK